MQIFETSLSLYKHIALQAPEIGIDICQPLLIFTKPEIKNSKTELMMKEFPGIRMFICGGKMLKFIPTSPLRRSLQKFPVNWAEQRVSGSLPCLRAWNRTSRALDASSAELTRSVRKLGTFCHPHEEYAAVYSTCYFKRTRIV